MRLKLLVCTNSSAIDIRSNSISLFHIIDGLASASFPFIFGPIEVVAVLVKEDGDRDTTLNLKINIGDKILANGPIDVSFGDLPGARAFAQIGSLLVPNPGTLTFTLMNGDAEMGEWPIEISSLSPEVVQEQVVAKR